MGHEVRCDGNHGLGHRRRDCDLPVAIDRGCDWREAAMHEVVAGFAIGRRRPQTTIGAIGPRSMHDTVTLAAGEVARQRTGIWKRQNANREGGEQGARESLHGHVLGMLSNWVLRKRQMRMNVSLSSVVGTAALLPHRWTRKRVSQRAGVIPVSAKRISSSFGQATVGSNFPDDSDR